MKSEKAFRAYEVAVRLGGQRVLWITVPPRRMGALEPAYTPAPRTPAPRCWQTAAGHNDIHRFRAQTQKAAPVNWQTRLSKPGIAHGYRKQSPSTPRRSQAAIAFMRTRERRIPTSTKAKSLWHRFQTRIGPLLRLQFLHLHNCIASRRIWLQRRPRLTHCRLQALRASLFAAASEANIPQIAVCSRRTEGVPRQKSLAAHLPSLARKHKGAGAFAPAPVREPQPSTPATEIRVNSHVPSLSQKP